MKIVLTNSKAKNKRYAAILYENEKKIKTINFGDIRYDNFLIT